MVSRISAAGDALGRPRQTDARRLDGAQQQAPASSFSITTSICACGTATRSLSSASCRGARPAWSYEHSDNGDLCHGRDPEGEKHAQQLASAGLNWRYLRRSSTQFFANRRASFSASSYVANFSAKCHSIQSLTRSLPSSFQLTCAMGLNPMAVRSTAAAARIRYCW